MDHGAGRLLTSNARKRYQPKQIVIQFKWNLLVSQIHFGYSVFFKAVVDINGYTQIKSPCRESRREILAPHIIERLMKMLRKNGFSVGQRPLCRLEIILKSIFSTVFVTVNLNERIPCVKYVQYRRRGCTTG